MTGEVEYRPLLTKCLFELGEILLQGYGKQNSIKQKLDHSPVTKMDLFSHHRLVQLLKSISDYPILSEEGVISFEERNAWERFWMIDPLDGTKAYIKGEGDFTINVALIEKGRPIESFILCPVRGELYCARRGHGAYLIFYDGKQIKLPLTRRKQMALFRSLSHEGVEMKKFQEKNPSLEDIPLSSAIKFGLVAREGPACYVRFAGSSEWDVAAGDLIVTEAGGEMFDLSHHRPLQYNSITLRNPKFIALSSGCRLSNLQVIG